MSVHGEKTGSYDNCVSVRSYPVSRRMGCLRVEAQPGPSVHDGARSATDPKAAWPNVRSHQLAPNAQPTVRDWFICLGHVDHDHQLDRVSIQDPAFCFHACLSTNTQFEYRRIDGSCTTIRAAPFPFMCALRHSDLQVESDMQSFLVQLLAGVRCSLSLQMCYCQCRLETLSG